MKVEDVFAALHALNPEADTFRHHLYDLCEEICADGINQVLARALYGLLEKFPDADFGSPGPVVHALETYVDFKTGLEESVARQPVPLTVWMVNRILNTDLSESERRKWVNLLERVKNHPNANNSTKYDAEDFLRFQANKNW